MRLNVDGVQRFFGASRDRAFVLLASLFTLLLFGGGAPVQVPVRAAAEVSRVA